MWHQEKQLEGDLCRIKKELDPLKSKVWQLEQDYKEKKELLAKLKEDYEKSSDARLALEKASRTAAGSR